MTVHPLEEHEFAWEPTTDFDAWKTHLLESGWMLDDAIPHRVAADGFHIYSFIPLPQAPELQ